MTRRLLLVRHAKSAWDAPSLDDRDRPLNKRGQRAAVALGEWLAGRGLAPDEVLCSPAARTRQTWERIAASLRDAPSPKIVDRLYAADREEILAVLQGATGRLVVLVGHNPGIGDFADRILSSPPDHPGFGKYPTGATLWASFDVADWNEVRPGTGRAESFVVPRDLEP